MTKLARSLPLLALLAAAPLPCRASAAAAPERRSGSAVVKITGTHAAQGTFPATCGAYLMADVKGVGKAGDGLVFETRIPDLGGFQLVSKRRQPGRSSDAGLVLNAADASYLGDAPEAQVTFGPDLWSASVKATLRPLRRPRKGEAAKELKVDLRFDCPR